MAEIKFESPDSLLEARLDGLLEAHGIIHQKTASQADHSGMVVSYAIGVRPDVNLDLSFSLVLDQMEVGFNSCVLIVEEAAYMPRMRTNPTSRHDWRSACLELVEGVLTSPLRIEVRRFRDCILGGYLYRREKGRWQPCGGGGSVFMCLGARDVSNYEDWLLRDQPNKR